VLAAVMLTDKPITLYDCPNLSDVKDMLDILKAIGGDYKREKETVFIDPSGINNWKIPDKQVKKIRSSVIIIGAALARFGKADITYPGGCEIGLRPIDLHLNALRKLGVNIEEDNGYLRFRTEALVGTDIYLDYPSVGATENVMLAAVGAQGETVIHNAAREPEIIDLAQFINSLGGDVRGAGSNTVIIAGGKKLSGCEYRMIPDRIIAGTYMAAAAITGGDVWIDNIIMPHVRSVVEMLKMAGCELLVQNKSIKVKGPKRLNAIKKVETMPYPGFPTDMQAQLTTMLSVARGVSVIKENIFENRYKFVPQLRRMGANIQIEDRVAIIDGKEKLHGAEVRAEDLRGGAALVLAGLAAEGETKVSGIRYIERGYQDLAMEFNQLGADIKVEDEK
jgi:UDP-N-acetylglucosamine 1-carboxyvinyltransferase